MQVKIILSGVVKIILSGIVLFSAIFLGFKYIESRRLNNEVTYINDAKILFTQLHYHSTITGEWDVLKRYESYKNEEGWTNAGDFETLEVFGDSSDDFIRTGDTYELIPMAMMKQRLLFVWTRDGGKVYCTKYGEVTLEPLVTDQP